MSVSSLSNVQQEKTWKCWTIVSLSEASPLARLIARCSPPFPPHPLLCPSLCYTEVLIFPELPLCRCNLQHKSPYRNLELHSNHCLFVPVSNPLTNIHNLTCPPVASLPKHSHRLVKTICQQYDFRMGTKRRTLFCLSVEQSCPTDGMVAAEDHGTDMCHTFTQTQSLRFTGYISAWELHHSVVFDQKPKISVSYILNSFIFNSLDAVAQNTGEPESPVWISSEFWSQTAGLTKTLTFPLADADPESSAGLMLPPLHYTHFTAYTWNDKQAGLYLQPSRSVRCHECVLDDLLSDKSC